MSMPPMTCGPCDGAPAASPSQAAARCDIAFLGHSTLAHLPPEVLVNHMHIIFVWSAMEHNADAKVWLVVILCQTIVERQEI